MLQYAVYSVISPEGCASILMKDARQAASAANALKLTAEPAKAFGVIDDIIAEPLGGAHRDLNLTAGNIKAKILEDLTELKTMSPLELREHRIERNLAMGSSGHFIN